MASTLFDCQAVTAVMPMAVTPRPAWADVMPHTASGVARKKRLRSPPRLELIFQ